MVVGGTCACECIVYVCGTWVCMCVCGGGIWQRAPHFAVQDMHIIIIIIIIIDCYSLDRTLGWGSPRD